MKSVIKIKVLNIDHGDDTIQFQGFFSNGYCSTTLNFYGDAEEFKEFSTGLIEFPKTLHDKITYKLGDKEGRWAYYLLMEASYIESNGHSALKIEVLNNASGPSNYESKFEIESDPSELNRLGNELKTWNPFDNVEFEWKPNE